MTTKAKPTITQEQIKVLRSRLDNFRARNPKVTEPVSVTAARRNIEVLQKTVSQYDEAQNKNNKAYRLEAWKLRNQILGDLYRSNASYDALVDRIEVLEQERGGGDRHYYD